MTAPTTNATDRSMSPASDRVDEEVRLSQPRSRVWRALTDATELGAWFGADFGGATIAPGAHVRGNITNPGYEYIVIDLMIEEVAPERLFSWRWHPHAVERGADYSAEPRTLVEFTLEDLPDGGTLLRVAETGFGALPESRRATALVGNGKGWTGQLQKRIPAYLASAA